MQICLKDTNLPEITYLKLDAKPYPVKVELDVEQRNHTSNLTTNETPNFQSIKDTNVKSSKNIFFNHITPNQVKVQQKLQHEADTTILKTIPNPSEPNQNNQELNWQSINEIMDMY